MNERIIKIGLESGMLNYVDNETPRHYFLSGHADEQDLAKFAQLIVQECMAQVEGQFMPVFEDVEMMRDPHWDGYVQCGVDSYVAIREHFYGVEE